MIFSSLPLECRFSLWVYFIFAFTRVGVQSFLMALLKIPVIGVGVAIALLSTNGSLEVAVPTSEQGLQMKRFLHFSPGFFGFIYYSNYFFPQCLHSMAVWSRIWSATMVLVSAGVPRQ
ncbi:hypothetical protein B0O99DRAFT_353843 [Bisporella sp. PMI_857]|nr:hypothetical protein B0O99DRAFT_353843 [Bisporella sp. PMI_857]